MKKRIFYGCLSVVLAFALVFVSVPVQARCSSLAAGKKATVDKSVLFGHNEDDGPCPTLMHVVPRIDHEPGETIELWNGGTLEQVVGETWAYTWSYMPGYAFSDSYLNEWGVAIASDASGSREPYPGDLTDGGITYWTRRVVAERAKTAREGVLLIGEMNETFGYASSGRTLIVADPKEAWLVQQVRGRHWCAQRVPDDHVAFIPNRYTIREVNLKDKKNFLASPDLIEHAIDMGWYDPDGGEPFEFAKAYGRNITKMDTRQWAALRLLTGIEYDPDEMAPFSVKPNRKLSVEDIIEVLRTHYEGTEYEPEWVDPHWPHSGDPRRICVGSTQESFVMQLRSYMPSFVGNVYWRAQGTPCSTVYSPWYSGILEIPKPYTVGKSNRTSAPPEYYDPDAADDMNSAYWAFRKMADLVEEDYLARKALVRGVWDEYEAAAFELQDRIEETALHIYRGNKRKKGKKDEENEYLARWFLTRHAESLALNAYFKALEFIELFEEY